MLASKFIETELNAYIKEQRLTESPLMVKLIIKAFEAYDEYRRLVSPPSNDYVKPPQYGIVKLDKAALREYE